MSEKGKRENLLDGECFLKQAIVVAPRECNMNQLKSEIRFFVEQGGELYSPVVVCFQIES